MFLNFLIQVINALEINTGMGFAKSAEKEKLLVVNGVYPVEFNLQFENQLISLEEVRKMSKVGDWDCTDFNPTKLIEKLNAQLSDKFWELFEPLELDLKSKQRSQRGIVATAVVGAGMTLVDKLLGKAVDYLFDSRSRKTEHSVQQLEASLYTIKHELQLSSLELCAFGHRILSEKIKRIGFELGHAMENQIRNEIQKLYFGELDNKFKLSACEALNERATKFDCLKIIRNKDFAFNILAIEIGEDVASIQLQILTPILSKIIIGHRIFNLGVPMVKADSHCIVKGFIPDFITTEHEYKFKSEPMYNVIDENSILLSPDTDRDCFKNNTDDDNKCDAKIDFVSTNFIINHVQGHTILLNFIQCSYTAINSIEEPKFFGIGTHVVKFDLGFLTCGEDRISFGHSSVSLKRHISYNSYAVEFNLKEPNIIKNNINQNIFDQDHMLEQVSIFPNISLRLFLIILILTFLVGAAIGFFCFYRQIKSIFRSHAPPALVY